MSIDLFSSFEKEELLDLFSTRLYQVKRYERGQLIHLQNEICMTIDLILDGDVSVQHIIENGNVLTVSAFSARDMIGANLIFASSNYYPMTVLATSDTTILNLQRGLVLDLCKSSEFFMVEFMKAISDKAIILTDKINAISLKTIRKSIIDFLRYEYHLQKTVKIKLHSSKKDLAERLGVQRSSLSRELNKMRMDGLVEYDARSITLKNININEE